MAKRVEAAPPTTDDERAREAERRRHAGDPKGALAILEKGGRATTRLRVEEALCAFAVGDGARAAAAVEGDPVAAGVLAPLRAAEGLGEVPRSPKGSTALRKRLHEIARGVVDLRRGDESSAANRFWKLQLNGGLLNPLTHYLVLEAQGLEGDFHAFAALGKLDRRIKNDPELEAALGRALASSPVAHMAKLSKHGRAALEKEQIRREKGEAGSPVALLHVEPARVDRAERGPLHLHRGFALLREDPRRAEQELEAALREGADQTEVWRGLYLASLHGDERRARKPLARLSRALERCPVPEPAFVVALARARLATVLEDGSAARDALGDAERLAERCAPSKDVRFGILQRRALLRELEGDLDGVVEATSALLVLRPTEGEAWKLLAQSEIDRGTDDAEILEIFRRGQAALAASSGPDVERRRTELREVERAFRRRQSLFVEPANPSEWGRAYFEKGGQDATGRPSDDLARVREGFTSGDARACLILEAGRRAALGGPEAEAWCRVWLERAPEPGRDAVLEIMARVAPAVVRAASAGLPEDQVVELLQSSAQAVVPVLVKEHADRLPTRVLRAAKKVRPSQFRVGHPELRAASARLQPDIALADLITEGPYYEPDAEELDFPEELELLRHLDPEHARSVLDEAELKPGDPLVMAAMVEAVEEAAEKAELAGEFVDLPPPFDEILSIMSAADFRRLAETAGGRGVPRFDPVDDIFGGDLPPFDIPFDAPYGPPSGGPAAKPKRADRKAQKKREKQNRKQNRGKKKKKK